MHDSSPHKYGVSSCEEPLSLMKTRILIPLIASAFLFLTGCEGAKFPLSDPGYSSIDERLIGSWGIVETSDDDESYLNVFAFDENAYYVEVWDEGDEDDIMRLNVFSTVIDGVSFANIRCISCDEDNDDYFFFKYDVISQEELLVHAINDDLYDELEELESVDAVRKYVQDHMNDPDFYDEGFARYRRLDSDPLERHREG